MRPFLPALVACAIAVPAAAQQSIKPGYWETINQVVSPLPSKKKENRCIRPQDVAKFMQGPSNHIYMCTYPTRDIGGGRIRLEGSCTTKKGTPIIPVSGRGVFTEETLRLDARIAAQIGGLTVPIHARTTAKRIGDICPVDAPDGN